VRWGKVACWSTKAASLKRVKIDEKLLWRAYRNSELTNALSNGTYPDPLRPPLPQDWGFATPAQKFNCNISGMGKATDFKFGWYIQKIHPKKSPLKILEKRDRGHIQGLFIFEYPYYITNFKFCTYILQDRSEQKPITNFGKRSRGRTQRFSKRFRAPMHIGLYKAHDADIRGHLCDSSAFLSCT